MKSASAKQIQKNEFGKIPLPWASEPQRNIAWENTHAYWQLSQDWNGTGIATKGATVGDALTDCNEILESQHTGQKLFLLVSELRDDIIQHGSKKRKVQEIKRSKNPQEIQPAKAYIL